MAIPSTPSNFYVQQGNGQVFLSWDLTSGATTYPVQRSTDGVTFSTLSTPATNYYLDTAVTIGTNYYYKVAATNVDGTSAYTSAQSVVPTSSGTLSLGQLRLMSQQRADRVNSKFVTTPEWNTYINQSLFELYDLLVNSYEDYALASPVTFSTDGSARYALPNGTNYSGASPFYKMMGVDLALNQNDDSWIPIPKFNFIDRNNYIYPTMGATFYGAYNLSYRVMGSNIEFIPSPSSGQTVRLWYIPRFTQLLKDTDIADGYSGWLEYVIVDAAIKALQKEESDTSVLLLQKQALIKRIEESASNRDAGQPDTISDTRSISNGYGWNGFNGTNGGI